MTRAISHQLPMYVSHFHLISEPFALTPDPAFLYLSPGHAEALAALKIGLTGRRGLIVMTGEVGTGKTTLLYSLLTQLGPNVHSAYISNTRLPFDDMLRHALADFGIRTDSRDRVELLNRLNDFLRHCASEGAIAALVIDEAQNLDDDTFENLRLLSNFETFTTKLLQIVLVGQPELEARLRQPHLRQVAERVAVHCHINPLTRRERRNYIEHRLECVGGSTDLFTRAALRLVLRKARGIPRRMNILCHNALLFAYGRGARRVSLARMRAAVREREGRGLTTTGGRRPLAFAARARRLRPLGAAVAGAAALVIVAAATGHVPLPWHGAPAWIPSLGWLRPDVTAPVADQPASNAAAPLDVSTNQADSLSPFQDLQVQAQAEVSAGESAPVADAAAPRRRTTADTAAGPSGFLQPARVGSYIRVVRVAPGVTLAILAKDTYGEVNEHLLHRIQLANPQIVDPNRIRAGDTLRFPPRDAALPNARATP